MFVILTYLYAVATEEFSNSLVLFRFSNGIGLM